jgi:hypothetical protein
MAELWRVETWRVEIRATKRNRDRYLDRDIIEQCSCTAACKEEVRVIGKQSQSRKSNK